jgi:hypothetical protein
MNIKMLAVVFVCAQCLCSAVGFCQQADNKVILLANDNVMVGSVEIVPGGYRVKTSNGVTITIGVDDVAAVCRSFKEIYELKQYAILANQPQKHIELSKWCLLNGLISEAKQQYGFAKDLIGEHEVVLDLRRQIASAEAENKADTTVNLSKASTQAKTDQSESESQVMLTGYQLDEMMRNIPKDVLDSYSSYIQSPLISGCTVSGCHLSNDSKFRLHRRSLHSPVPRRLTQRNLVTMIQWANQDHLDRSVLLEKASGAHGELKQPVWPQDSQPYLFLRQWIAGVQELQIDLTGGEPDKPESTFSRKTANQPTRQSNSDENSLTTDKEFIPSVPTNQNRTVVAETVDPFDPSEFNRRFFGQQQEQKKQL